MSETRSYVAAIRINQKNKMKSNLSTFFCVIGCIIQKMRSFYKLCNTCRPIDLEYAGNVILSKTVDTKQEMG